MDRPGGKSPVARAEDLLRLLAVAANAVRLYPESSPIRDEAIARFADAGSALAAYGPIQLRVDRERFLLGNAGIGSPGTAIASLAESLHALQVGQLVVAPGISTHEAAAFLQILGAESKAVRASGGMRKALLEVGVSNIAVIEVTLRASTEEGLAGLDLTAAPLDEIGREVAAAAERWAESAAQGVAGVDEMAAAIEKLETATRDVAAQRVAQALLHLDEATRVRVLESALATDGTGAHMDGMLDAIAKMPPAALARLLRIVAEHSGSAPDSLLGTLEIPPEIARELAALLRPAAQTESDRGVPATPDVPGIAAEVAEPDEGDQLHIEALVRESTPALAASRALVATIQVARTRPAEDAVRALGESVRAALGAGAYGGLGAAFALLDELALRPELLNAVASVRTPLAEQILNAYTVAPEEARAALVTQMSRMAEVIGPAAGRILRDGDPAKAASVVRFIASAGDKRLLPFVAQALDHIDIAVRAAALSALADAPGVQSTALLQKSLSHWDPETRRVAAREIGRAEVLDAVPALLKILEDVNLFERNYELKKEVFSSIENLRPAQAIPVLSRIAGRRLVIGKKNRELRYRAKRTLELLETASSHRGEHPK
ncbi:MAG: hypothetical protein WBI63_07580 [Coriobacteriia bacterium]